MTLRRSAGKVQQLGPGDGPARRWRRRRAVGQLAANLSAQNVDLLAAEAVRLDGDPAVRQAAQEALERVVDQEHVDVLCSRWVSSRHPALGELIVRRRWVATGPPPIRALSALKAGVPEALAEDDGAVVPAVVAALGDSDPAVARCAKDALRSLRNPLAIQALSRASFTHDERTRGAVKGALAALDQATIDAVCDLWARTRHRALGTLVAKSGWVARRPVDVRVQTALHCGRPEALANDGPQIVPLLLSAAHGKRGDPEVQHARRALELLTHPEAQEALCRDVIENDDPVAAEAARSGGFAPADPHDRALFFFLTRQWDRYEDLDFDQSLLHAAYAVADGALRERLAASARADGRREWVSVVAGSRRGRRLSDMSDREWETALAVLARSKRWEELWRLAQEGPARWAARYIARLGDVGWLPEDPEERERFVSLLTWAEDCEGQPPTSLLARRGELLHRFPKGVRSLACSPDGRTLAVSVPGGGVQVWTLPARTPRGTVEASAGGENDLCFTADGSSLVSAGYDGVIRIWSLRELGKGARVVGKHAGAANAVSMVDGRMLVSAGFDKVVRRWDLLESNRRSVWRGHSRSVSSLAVVDQAGLLASAGRDGVRLWSLGNGASRPVPRMLNGVVVLELERVSQLQLAVLIPDGSVRLWSLPDGGVRQLHAWARVTTLGGVPERGTALLGTSDGRLLALPTPDAGDPSPVGTGHDGTVTAVAASQNGDVIVTAGADGRVLVWEPELYRWDRIPLGEASGDDLHRLEQMLRGPMTPQERPWLELAAGLLKWRRRHDIDLSLEPVIELGEFDIEIGAG